MSGSKRGYGRVRIALTRQLARSSQLRRRDHGRRVAARIDHERGRLDRSF
jgi:hypothetical protein